MIGCAMKNREGDLRVNKNNILIAPYGGGSGFNFRFELTYMNNSDVWTNNVLIGNDGFHVQVQYTIHYAPYTVLTTGSMCRYSTSYTMPHTLY
jgi:hypothetical protein